jgi:hypothetical protein
VHQSVHGPSRIERSRYDVAQIDDDVSGPAFETGEHRVERSQVAVDV